MDITTYTMILTAKLSAMAFCYKDGGEKEENLLKEQKYLKIEKLPSVIEVLSYVYFPGACIAGPFFEFADYKRFIEKKERFADIPNPILPSLKRFLHGHCK